MANHWDVEDWIKSMRMSSDAFNLLCNTLRPLISKEEIIFRKCTQLKLNLLQHSIVSVEQVITG